MRRLTIIRSHNDCRKTILLQIVRVLVLGAGFGGGWISGV